MSQNDINIDILAQKDILSNRFLQILNESTAAEKHAKAQRRNPLGNGLRVF